MGGIRRGRKGNRVQSNERQIDDMMLDKIAEIFAAEIRGGNQDSHDLKDLVNEAKNLDYRLRNKGSIIA